MSQLTALQKTPLTAEDLAQFTGSDTWYRHGIVPRISYRDAGEIPSGTLYAVLMAKGCSGP